MKKREVKQIKTQLKRDLALIEHFIKNYFSFDDCNCNDCCLQRNSEKYNEMARNLSNSSYLYENEIKHTNNAIITHLNNFIKDIKQAIKSYDGYTLKNLDDYTCCKYCRQLIYSSNINSCIKCRNKYTVKCKDCGRVLSRRRQKNCEHPDYCVACAENLEKCHLCGCVVSKNEIRHRDIFMENSTNMTYNVSVCKHCDDAYIMSCDDCGKFCHGNSVLHYNGNDYCPVCINKHRQYFAWNYRPDFVDYTSKREEHYDPKLLRFGCELEVESLYFSRKNAIKNGSKFFPDGFLYGKEDGSVPSGFEFVTHPFSWDWLVENKDRFNSLFTFLKLGEFQAPSCCGFHIHLTKAAFTTFHLYKFISFIDNCKHREFMVKVARRNFSTNRYCAPYSQNGELPSYKKTYAKIAKLKSNCNYSRYTAVNLTVPETAEVRIFRGTTNIEDFFTDIEFLHVLYEFTKDTSAKKINVSNFCKFALMKKKTHRNLTKFITDYIREAC